MKTPHIPDSRLPWRIVKTDEGLFQVWTRYDDSLGSRNNYVIADDIQGYDDAVLLAAAPELGDALQSLLECVNVRIDDPRCAAFDRARTAVARATEGA